MGWTGIHLDKDCSGKYNRKAFLDKEFTHEKCHLLKSAMVGSVYYGAFKYFDGSVFAIICLTSLDNKDYHNFHYKDMDETEYPYECNCPKGILDLLTPTDNKYANDWRKACYNRLESKKNKVSTSSLPIGTKIRFKIGETEYNLEKKSPAHQFKTAWWLNLDRYGYFPKKHIPSNFEIVS